MSGQRLIPTPGSDQELARFADLQGRLRDRFVRFSADVRQPYTAVVVPSQSFDPKELAKISGIASYEERALFNLMLLRRPRLKVVFVTSKRLDPLIIDYYLHQMRDVPPGHAIRRLVLLDCDDASPRPLTQKILERPRLVQRLREAIDDRAMASLSVFNSTPLERTLAVQLGIPIYGCDPALAEIGTKTGSREVFRAASVPMPRGREGLRDRVELAEAVSDLWEEVPDGRRIVVKLDDSFSGEGNARLDLQQLADFAPGHATAAERRRAVAAALPSLQFEASGLEWEEYASQFDTMGGICEEWIEGEHKASPSIQMRINPVGRVQIVSTHDQVLGGPGGQIFTGATFPADAAYRGAIRDLGRSVGRELASLGTIGRFGVDFVVVPSNSLACPPRVFAIEINMRQGGTTHPFNTLKFLTDGRYDEESGLFRTAQGHLRSYFATDNLRSDSYRGTLPFDLIGHMVNEGTHFRTDETGVVFHLLGCVSEFGKLGCTAIAESVDEARDLYADTVRHIDRFTSESAAPAPLPEP